MKYYSALLLSVAALIALTLPGPVRGEPLSSSQESAKPYRLGFMPYAMFSDDKGFGFGIIVQWDDKRSPDYQPYYLSHRIMFERTTRGIGDYSYRLDSKYILPASLRLTLEARYIASLFEPYHGPGGAQTEYNSEYVDTRGKYYYMYDKRYLQVNTLVQGWLKGEELRWLAGLVILRTWVDTMDYTDYNQDPGETLLAHHWEGLGADTAGGLENGLLAGIVWDRRDHETSPRKGFWSEVLLRWVPNISGNDFTYTVLTATHRQYVPLSEALTFAFRFSGRFMTDGAPFFTMPRLDGSFKTETGLGGNKTIRGVLWQRAVGNRFFYGNLELRYRILSLFRTGYLAGSAFYDFGRTFDKPHDNMFEHALDKDQWHRGVGIGGRLAPNDTFIIALDLGWAVDASMDGPGVKVYMGLDWLF